ncbi:hypothetical protein [Photobacterium kasasachensis]|uniref:hypothetical protein n=1 Tax=Photobacterium kasasachensis TaxID=2910240 RepID=UPI003D12F576
MLDEHSYKRVSHIRINTIFILLIILSGCSVKLISNYDEGTDKAVTQLQKDLEFFLVTIDNQLGLPECKYDNHKKFYQDTYVSISAIEVRTKALDKNEITVEQVGLLKDSFSSMESLHKLSCLNHKQIELLRSGFNSSVTAILKLELAKKRGE